MLLLGDASRLSVQLNLQRVGTSFASHLPKAHERVLFDKLPAELPPGCFFQAQLTTSALGKRLIYARKPIH